MSYHWLDIDNHVARRIKSHYEWLPCATCHGEKTIPMDPDDLDSELTVECPNPDCVNGFVEIDVEE